jgi:O-antigen/teichoic acid export membrane protein
LAIRRNVLVSFGSNGVVYACQLITTMVVSRLLTPAEVGAFTVPMAAAAVLQGMRDFGIGAYLVQEKELNDDKIRTVFGIAILVGWTIAGILFLSRHIIAAFYGNEAIAETLAILSAGFAFFPFGLPATGMLMREMKFFVIAKIAIFSAIAGSACTIWLALAGYSAASLAYGAVIGSAITSFAALLYWPKHIFLRPSLRAWREIAPFGLKASLAATIGQVGGSSPELIIGRSLGLEAASFLSRGRSLPLVLERLVVMPVSSTMAPILAAAIRKNEDVSVNAIKAVQLVCIIGWPALAFMIANADEIITVLYGKNWLPASILMQAVCISQCMLFLNVVAITLYAASGNVTARLRKEIIVQSLTVALVAVASTKSLHYVALALPIAALFSFVLHFGIVRKEISFSIGRFLRHLVAPALTSVLLLSLAIAMNIAVRQAFFPAETSSIAIFLLIELGIYGIFYLLALWMQRHFLILSLLSQYKANFGK